MMEWSRPSVPPSFTSKFPFSSLSIFFPFMVVLQRGGTTLHAKVYVRCTPGGGGGVHFRDDKIRILWDQSYCLYVLPFPTALPPSLAQ